MLSGRIVWGIVQAILLGIGGNGFTIAMFISSAFLNAIPGIIIQLVMIPLIMLALDKTHLVPMRKCRHTGVKADEVAKHSKKSVRKGKANGKTNDR
jgi:hypothetical protein